MARGNKVFRSIQPQISDIPLQFSDSALDVILHALHARVALSDNNTVEFQTRYDPNTNIVELDFPDELLPIFDQLIGMQRGPRMQAYIDWLIGRQSIVDSVIVPEVAEAPDDIDQNFVPAGDLKIFTNATIGNLDDEKIVIFLPTDCLSVVGYNTKASDTFAGGNLTVSLVWVYEGGDNGSAAVSFDLQTTVNIAEIGTTTSLTVTDTKEISTFNLVKNDVRETNLIVASGVQAGDMIQIVIRRNYEGSTDEQTEFIGILGLKVELEEI